jgi:hypothetical protein
MNTLPGRLAQSESAQRLSLERLDDLLRFSATDDLGTNYRHSRGGSSGSVERGEESGIADFQPAAPIKAKSFVVRAHEATITILLT